MKVIYERHPVTPERKAELRQQGYTIIDAVFAPKGHGHTEAKRQQAVVQVETSQINAVDGLDELDTEQLRALAKERGIKVHANAGADKVREALRSVVNV